MRHLKISAVSFAALVAGFAVPAVAGSTDAQGDTVITVLASGLAQPIDQSGQSISVIGDKELQSLQTPDLAAALSRLPGVSLARTGGLGAATSLFVRGADSDQVLVLIDGVKVADTSSPAASYDFGALTAGGLGKVELLRGSNSVVWGSSAIGGVLALTSREINGGDARVEYGSNESLNAETSLGLKRDAYALSVNAGYLSSDGIPTTTGDTQPSWYDQYHVSGRGRITLLDGLNFVASGRYLSATNEYDSYTGAGLTGYQNLGATQVSQQASGRAELNYTSGLLAVVGGVSLNDQRRATFSPGESQPNATYDGRTKHIDLNGHVVLPAAFSLDLGADSDWNEANVVSAYDNTSANSRMSSGHALLGWKGDQDGHALVLAVGERLDSHSQFGDHWSFGANGTLGLVDNLRLRASYGEGFKAPSLYQLFDPYYGTATLKPTTSQSYDIGLEKGDRSGRLHGALTWFHRDTSNEITLDDTWHYQNIAKARAEGLEAEFDARPIDSLQIHAAYTYVHSTNQSTGAYQGWTLVRRPRHTLTLAGDWASPLYGLKLGADVRFAALSYDYADGYSYDGGLVRLGGYAVLGLRASVPLSDRVEAYGRVENLGNVHYELVNGYNQPGRTATIGVRAKL